MVGMIGIDKLIVIINAIFAMFYCIPVISGNFASALILRKIDGPSGLALLPIASVLSTLSVSSQSSFVYPLRREWTDLIFYACFLWAKVSTLDLEWLYRLWWFAGSWTFSTLFWDDRQKINTPYPKHPGAVF